MDDIVVYLQRVTKLLLKGLNTALGSDELRPRVLKVKELVAELCPVFAHSLQSRTTQMISHRNDLIQTFVPRGALAGQLSTDA